MTTVSAHHQPVRRLSAEQLHAQGQHRLTLVLPLETVIRMRALAQFRQVKPAELVTEAIDRLWANPIDLSPRMIEAGWVPELFYTELPELRAEITAAIRSLRAQHLTATEIAERLNENGLGVDNRPWTARRVSGYWGAHQHDPPVATGEPSSPDEHRSDSGEGVESDGVE